jgi:hypothetical protein
LPGFSAISLIVIICSFIPLLLKGIFPTLFVLYGKLCQFLNMYRVRVRIDANAVPNGVVHLPLLNTLMANAALLFKSPGGGMQVGLKRRGLDATGVHQIPSPL